METDLAPNKTILLPWEFLNDVAGEAAKARSHIVGQSMCFDADPSLRFSKALVEAFNKTPPGVRRELYLDWYARMVSDEAIDNVNLRLPWKHDQALRAVLEKRTFFKEIRESGINLNFVNPPESQLVQLLPIYGRDHLKGVDIDGSIFYFGKLNADSYTASAGDFMIKFTDERATGLSEVFAEIHRGEINDDLIVEIGLGDRLYVDNGTPEQSIVYGAALSLVSKAKNRIRLVCAMLPENNLAKTLVSQANQGLDVEILACSPDFNPFDFLTMPNLYGLGDRLTRFKNRLTHPNLSLQDNLWRNFHSCFVVVDDEEAIVMTHNLSERGVKAGTRDWGLLTQDQELITNLNRQYFDFRLEADSRVLDLI